MDYTKFELPYDGLDVFYRDVLVEENKETILTPVDQLTKEERIAVMDDTMKAVKETKEGGNVTAENPSPQKFKMMNLFDYINYIPGDTSMDRDMLVQLFKTNLIGKLVLAIHEGQWYRIKEFVEKSPYEAPVIVKKKTLWRRLRFWKSSRLPSDVGNSLAALFYFKYRIRINQSDCIVRVEPIDCEEEEGEGENEPSTSAPQEVDFPLDVCCLCCSPKK